MTDAVENPTLTIVALAMRQANHIADLKTAKKVQIVDCSRTCKLLLKQLYYKSVSSHSTTINDANESLEVIE